MKKRSTEDNQQGEHGQGHGSSEAARGKAQLQGENVQQELQTQTVLQTQTEGAANQHQWLWFDDGRVTVIVSDGFSFKLHRGVLSHHSNVLKGLADAARTSAGESSDDTILRLRETGAQLSAIFEIMYDGGKSSYLNRDVSISFPALRAIMLVAIKYKVQHIVDAGIWRLKVLFPSDFDKWTNWPVDGVNHPISMKAEDARAVIELARLSDCVDLLPAAFYISSTLPYASLLHRVTYGTEAFRLSRTDCATCLNALESLQEMRGRITRAILEFCLDSPKVHQGMGHNCRVSLIALSMEALDDRVFTTQRCFDPIAPWLNEAEQRIGHALCTQCKRALKTELDKRMREECKNLGEAFGIENWPPA